jgi:hypothetical protein
MTDPDLDDEELEGFDDDDFDDDYEDDEDDFDCGKDADGLCAYAGSEDCDECPYRDEDEDDA